MFIVKVPLINGLGKTKGCEKAGNAILKSLKEIYSNESGKPIDVNLLDLEEIHAENKDTTDTQLFSAPQTSNKETQEVHGIDNSNLELSEKLIYENCLEIFEEKPKTIFLGGDHSISYSIGRAFLENCKKQDKEPCLIVFDSHPDCMPVTKGSENYPNHEEWLRALIEKGFPKENILLVGVRNSDKEEIEFMKKNKIKTISINSFIEDINNTCETIMEFSFGKELYVSIDIDVIDPAFASATGYCEPGGLTSREFIYLIQRMNKIKNLKAVDIVEINPEKDREFGMVTTKLGAKILGELI